MANRLSSARSPYLRQHAGNPVPWWEWEDAAFAEARERDVPILLSVGYAACHWCHVMAHESFEDAGIGARLAEGFVSIKVDREERPDIDAVYMAATQAMTGHGGWPMTVFLLPDGRPFYAGTYFPPTPRHGLPAFADLLDAVLDAWTTDRPAVEAAAGRITGALSVMTDSPPPGVIGAAELSAAARAVIEAEDRRHGGFGGAPKFPPSMTLEFLLRHHERTGEAEALAVVERALAGMAGGGMHDQLDGGFARYSVDAGWVVPHFEKMLYDNALLLRAYAHHARLTGSAASERVAEGIVEFLVRRLRTEEGAFASSLDADTNGVEGATYTWTPEELRAVLGDEDGAWAAELLDVTGAGTAEDGRSVLQLRRRPDDGGRWARVRTTLLAARDRRPQPDRDDKVIASWNGLTIGALAEAGLALDRPRWIDLAAAAARAVLDLHQVDGRLRRSSLAGAVGAAPGVLPDHADLAEGLLALYQATGATTWREAADLLLDTAVARFDGGDGSWYDTADDAPALVVRPRDPTDGATPSGPAALAEALLTRSALTGSSHDRELAERAVERAAAVVGQYPRAAGRWLSVAEALVSGPVQIAVVGPVSGPLLSVAARHRPPGSVLVGGEPGTSGIPLLADRPMVDGTATAYVCRGFVCDRPVTDEAGLIDLLRGATSGR